MERKRDSHRRGRNDRPGRHTPPPALTGAERLYFDRQAAEGAALTLSMCDGEQLSGKLVENDRDQLTLERDGALIVVRKSEIRYVAE